MQAQLASIRDYIDHLRTLTDMSSDSITRHERFLYRVQAALGRSILEVDRGSEINRVILDIAAKKKRAYNGGQEDKTGADLKFRLGKSVAYYVTWAHSENFIPRNFYPKNPFPKPHMIEAYYQKEERLWFLYCYEDFDLKSKVIIRTLINTAVRVSELVNMKVADIDFERGVVPVYMPKTRNWKEVPLYEPTIKAIKQMLEERTVESEYLLCVERRGDGRAKLGSKMSTGSVRRRLDRWAKRFNFRMNPHSFRHGIVTVWYKKLGLLAAAKLAGHIDLKYTAHYSHISGDEIREMGTKILPHEMWDAGSFVNSES